ncbi:hypothetical protein [Syntrophomonas wolfei]|uniref:CobQ/CobB/MinD/ParA nucleotide binding domain-containing protein n=1 Tax=Syntrophomonas wolfei subsp. wolfei (strain DSM 2245B / Goettingen) TaxID=335541 RepID=Q0AX45_SYNWW|nr:hypothetical protein [Syntrophomonas wolfei]ABI68709.1 conserved hypothetical protein [Syntrophomonas wolfei subsp. wolfei str. Goettingen G311]
MGKIAVFAGGFGSGKSEVAINFALEEAKRAAEVVLADLDMVNPFFASREVGQVLEKAGVKLFGPGGDLSFGDVPSIPAEIIALIQQENHLFIDLGGDEVGSLVMGYLSRFVKRREEIEVFLVLNPYRPFSSDLDGVSQVKQLIELAARVRITGIISNPNLVEETNLKTIIEGHRQVQEFAAFLQLPVKFLCVEERFWDQLLPRYGSILKKLILHLRPTWLQDI